MRASIQASPTLIKIAEQLYQVRHEREKKAGHNDMKSTKAWQMEAGVCTSLFHPVYTQQDGHMVEAGQKVKAKG